MSPNLCIVGGGAIGRLLEAALSKHVRVTVVSRPDTIDHVYSSYWICTKAYDLDDAVDKIQKRIVRSSPIILCSNGLGLYDQVIEKIGRAAPVLRFLMYVGARRENDSILTSGDLVGTLASLPNEVDVRDRFGALLEQSGFKLERSVNIAQAEWEKVIVNCVVNSLCSIIGKENGILLESTQLREVAVNLLNELKKIAFSEGIDLAHISQDIFFNRIENSRNNINSTLKDIRAGKRTEMEYFLGRAIRIAKMHGLKTPVSDTVYGIWSADFRAPRRTPNFQNQISEI